MIWSYSVEVKVADIMSNGKFFGSRASEHSQTSPDKIDYHECPNKKKVMEPSMLVT